MRLRDLDGTFLTASADGDLRQAVPTLEEAHGVMFRCPKCTAASGPVGAHMVICWFVGRVGDHVSPGPGRWNPSGRSLDDLTFVPPGAVSVALQGGCAWHGFVRAGDAT